MGYVSPLGSRISPGQLVVSGGQWSSLQVVTEEPVVAHSVVVTRRNAIIIQGKFSIEVFSSLLFSLSPGLPARTNFFLLLAFLIKLIQAPFSDLIFVARCLFLSRYLPSIDHIRIG